MEKEVTSVGVDMSIQGNSSEEISWQQKVHSELESPLAENPGGRRDGVGWRGGGLEANPQGGWGGAWGKNCTWTDLFVDSGRVGAHWPHPTLASSAV